jgi:nitrogen fixation-related uncharacterized protein
MGVAILIVVGILVLFDLAVWFWGVDSRPLDLYPRPADGRPRKI